MEVTCERCSTVYDFDDALVSERGTTVKCTTCSHQFKVRRTAPTAGPDVWIVRTVDGREIEFAALRDLQSAIYDGRVTREDVLVRGSSRPRRLGSIAELEPFFNRTGMTAPNPQRRARTLAGGAAAVPTVTSQRSENSAVFSLPNLLRSASTDHDEPHVPSVRRSTLPPPPPIPVKRDGQQPQRRASMPPPPPTPRSGSGGSPPPFHRGSIPPSPPAGTLGRRPPSGRFPNVGGRFGDPNSSDHYDDDYSNVGVERVSALPPPPPPPRRNSVPPPPPMFPAEPPPPLAETDNALRMFPDPERTKISKPPTPPEAPPPPAVAPPKAPLPKKPPLPQRAIKEIASASPSDKPSVDKPETTATNIEEPGTNIEEPATNTEEPGTDYADPADEPIAKAGGDTIEWVADESELKHITNEVPVKAPISDRSSSPGSLPMPSSRVSEPYSDPHHSGAIPTRRAGAARWIVGFVLLGCTALAAVTIGPKLMAKPTPTVAPPDARIAAFIVQGDRAMNDGDIETANEAYVKASAFAEKDALVELRLARLAIVHADVPWLKARLLSESDPELVNARKELTLAAARAHQATERAQAILPNDPDVMRCRIDTLRLQGNVVEARKLVALLPKPKGGSNDEVVFALLDLAEQSPTWSTVIDRLSDAARSEQNLGHARSMLIYALVQSGDIARGKSELDQLVAMPRPHPLIGVFRAYIAAAEKETSAGAVEEAGAPEDDTEALQAAIDATTKDDLEKATVLLTDLETRLPNDAKVLTAAGKLALKKKDRTSAVQYFEKAIAADKNEFDALAALGDLKWDSGEKQAASVLYRQLIERAGVDNPHVAQAKQRFSSYIGGNGEETPN